MRLAPSPYDASRGTDGTENIASSATDATSGVVRIPTPIPAAARLKMPLVEQLLDQFGLITVRAKNPSTTLGIPASNSTMGFSRRRIGREAYSER